MKNTTNAKSLFFSILILTIIAFTIPTAISIYTLKNNTLKDEQYTIVNVTQAAYNIALYYKRLSEKGVLSEKEAKKLAKETIRYMKYGKHGYFFIFIYSKPHKIVMHSAKPQLEGKTVFHEKLFKCAYKIASLDGKKVKKFKDKNVYDALALSTEYNNSGFTWYRWPKPKKEGGFTKEKYIKIAFSKRVPGWDWVIATGIYSDDLQNKYYSILKQNILYITPFALVILSILLFASRSYISLQDKLNRISFIVKQNPNGIVITDLDGNIVYANEAFLNTTGYKIDELIGKNPRILKSGKTPKERYKELWDTITNNKTWIGEFINKKKDGTIFIERATISPMFDIDGKKINYFAIKEDITKQKELEKKIKDTKEKNLKLFEELINSTIEGIIIYDKNLRCIKVNNIVTDLTGYTKEELIGKSVYDFIAPKYIDISKQKHKEHSTKPYEIEVIKKDGTTFPALVKGRYLNYQDEKVRVSSIIDITDIKKSEQKIIDLAYFDSLTKLGNRQKIIKDLDEGNYFACAIFNIRGFKEINDLFGVKNADTLLVQVANQFKNFSYPSYRISGDEFAILYNEFLGYDGLRNDIIKKLDILNGANYFIDNKDIKIHVNAGIAYNSNKLLTYADMALHLAKEKNLLFEFYKEDKKLEEQFRKNIIMTSKIHKAIKNDKIICYYQPIINIKTKKIEKFETLVRLLDEDGSIIPPNDFITISKKIKLYEYITIKVVEFACETFKDKDAEFSINLSVEDITNSFTISKITNIIQKYNLMQQVVFEILETESVDNYNTVVEFINYVKSLGAKIALDDFGSGYSNFEHILKLDIDYIKIDGSLIKGIENNRKNQIIVKTLIDFAKQMNAKTIAEFVSSKETYSMIEKLGIDYSQGYYTGKPGPM